MTNSLLRWLCLALVLAIGAGAVLAQGGAPPRDVRILFLEREEDPADTQPRGPDGIPRVPHDRGLAGAELAVRDAAATGRAIGASFRLERRALAEDADIATAIRGAAEDGISAVLLNFGPDDLRTAAKALPPGRLATFNIRDGDDRLRRDLCGFSLFHVAPSRAILTDALAQYIVAKNWKRVLALAGPEPDDAAFTRSFEASARKFGAKIVDRKSFDLGNDPRDRERNNIVLLTAGTDYDVLFVADAGGDVGRFFGYRQARPRPVIGSHGLVASAWHASSERYGAPQVNRRFERAAGRPMGDPDWSAWVAVKAVVEAVSRKQARTAPDIAAALSEVTVELSKGVAGSFRTWDHQLRQPIMLHTQDAVIDFAPIDGFLHEHSTLDTLGPSESEAPCGAATR